MSRVRSLQWFSLFAMAAGLIGCPRPPADECQGSPPSCPDPCNPGNALLAICSGGSYVCLAISCGPDGGSNPGGNPDGGPTSHPDGGANLTFSTCPQGTIPAGTQWLAPFDGGFYAIVSQDGSFTTTNPTSVLQRWLGTGCSVHQDTTYSAGSTTVIHCGSLSSWGTADNHLHVYANLNGHCGFAELDSNGNPVPIGSSGGGGIIASPDGLFSFDESLNRYTRSSPTGTFHQDFGFVSSVNGPPTYTTALLPTSVYGLVVSENNPQSLYTLDQTGNPAATLSSSFSLISSMAFCGSSGHFCVSDYNLGKVEQLALDGGVLGSVTISDGTANPPHPAALGRSPDGTIWVLLLGNQQPAQLGTVSSLK